MRVVVAGSTGLLGSALVAGLRQAGHDVTRLIRRTPAAPDERRWDPPSGRIDDGALDGAEALINLCGAGIATRRWTHARKQILLDSRVVPTEVLATAASEHEIPLLINGSATGYYGETTTPADETAPRGAGFLADLCERWESATEPATQAGVRVVLARTAQVLSPSGGLLGPLRPLFWLALGGRLGSGKQYQPWIHLDDHVAAMVSLLTNGVSGPVNLSGPTPASNAEFTRALGKAMHRPAPWLVPKPALRLALGEVADEILKSQNVQPKVLLDNGFQFRYATVDDALAAVVSR